MKNGGVKLTFKPKFNSFKEVLISLVSEFIRSHSCNATIVYGVFSSTLWKSSRKLNSSGNLSIMSSSFCFILKPRTLQTQKLLILPCSHTSKTDFFSLSLKVFPFMVRSGFFINKMSLPVNMRF